MLRSPFMPPVDIYQGPSFPTRYDGYASPTAYHQHNSELPIQISSSDGREHLQLVVDKDGKASVILSDSSDLLDKFLCVPSSPSLSCAHKHDSKMSPCSYTVLGSSECNVQAQLTTNAGVLLNPDRQLKSYTQKAQNANVQTVDPKDTLINPEYRAVSNCSPDEYPFEYGKRRVRESDDIWNSSYSFEQISKRLRLDGSSILAPNELFEHSDALVDDDTLAGTIHSSNGSSNITALSYEEELSRYDMIERILDSNLSLKPQISRVKCCDVNFTNALKLAKHLDGHHGAEYRRFRCSDPNCVWSALGYRVFTELKRHLKTVHAIYKDHVCKVCEREFSRSDALLRHMKTKHLEKER